MQDVLLAPIRAALAAIFPTPCAGCGCPLAWGEPLVLCDRCLPRLRPPALPACRGCGRPLAGVVAGGPFAGDPPSDGLGPAATAGGEPGEVGWQCGACRRQPPPWEALAAAYLYLPPLVGVIRALKFGRAEYLGEALAAALAIRCRPWAEAVDLVAPVPLAWTRLLGRGYNQAEAIARPLAEQLGLPCRPLLRRQPRPRQALLRREERRRNLKGAFTVRAGAAGARVLLVDDVMTTGATLAAAAAALRRGGASRVLVAVVARTPDASWGEPER